MGLCIELRTESGEQLGFVADEKNLLGQLLESPDPGAFPMLASIDHYGDTVFNRIQMRRFLDEWTTLSRSAKTPAEEDLLQSVGAMAEKAAQAVHLYLVFVGD
ncbi:MAG TPA: hypothetical protein VHU89_17515 [Acidobacteriaceae bacterium]|jgi:hypothetical protein|nr:hypothetical protein [Acidobacteriaceae bacterium]